MPNERSESQPIGVELLRYASEGGTVRYGRITEMFPFIYEASRKLGLRAISRWLAEKGEPISPATISRALAKPEAHWQALARQIEPYAQLLKEAFDFPNYDFLFGPATPSGLGVPEEFSARVRKRFDERCQEGIGEMTDEEFRRALAAEPCEKYLGKVWYVLSEETRENCRKYFTNINSKNEGQG